MQVGFIRVKNLSASSYFRMGLEICLAKSLAVREMKKFKEDSVLYQLTLNVVNVCMMEKHTDILMASFRLFGSVPYYGLVYFFHLSCINELCYFVEWMQSRYGFISFCKV